MLTYLMHMVTKIASSVFRPTFARPPLRVVQSTVKPPGTVNNTGVYVFVLQDDRTVLSRSLRERVRRTAAENVTCLACYGLVSRAPESSDQEWNWTVS